MAAEDQWAEFEKAWTALLKREGLKSFHMHDIHNRVGDGWNRARSDMMIHDFREVIRAMDVVGIASVVRTDDWMEIIARDAWLTQRLISPSHLALEHVIQQAVHWAQRRSEAGVDPEMVATFFDLRQQDLALHREAAALYRKEQPWRQWFAGADFVSMDSTLPLQAADMLAWETYHLDTGRQRNAGETELRTHLKAILRDIPVHGQYYDREALEALAGQIIRRERIDLVKPQGSAPSQGFFTTVQKADLFRLFDTLGEPFLLNWLEDAILGLDRVGQANARREFKAMIETFKDFRKRSEPWLDGAEPSSREAS